MPVYGISQPTGWKAAVHAIGWGYPVSESGAVVVRLSLRCWNDTSRTEMYVHQERGFVASSEHPVQPWPLVAGSVLAEEAKGVVLDAFGYLSSAGVVDDQLQAWESWAVDGSATELPGGEAGLVSIAGQTVPVQRLHVPGRYWLLVARNPVSGTHLAVHGYDEVDHR